MKEYDLWSSRDFKSYLFHVSSFTSYLLHWPLPSLPDPLRTIVWKLTATLGGMSICECDQGKGDGSDSAFFRVTYKVGSKEAANWVSDIQGCLSFSSLFLCPFSNFHSFFFFNLKKKKIPIYLNSRTPKINAVKSDYIWSLVEVFLFTGSNHEHSTVVFEFYDET